MNVERENRGLIIRIFFILAAAVLIGKAFQLQVLNPTYAERARATAVDRFTIYPERGLIFDRNHELLIENNIVYDLLVTYSQIDPDMDTLKFCQLLNITKEDFEARLDKDFRDIRYDRKKPFVFMRSISSRVFTGFKESLYEFPGFVEQQRTVRGYPYPNAAHVLGFIREVNEEEIEAENSIYALGDYIGASGLEKQYETELGGTKGVRFVLKDNLGQMIGEYKGGVMDELPVAGNDLITGLDIDLQQYAEWLMQNKIGGIVAIEPSSGEVLAMVSSPTYDPNLLVINRHRGEAVSTLSADSTKPFFNRAVMAQYPPGSTFKAVVGLVGMQEEVMDAKKAVSCPGYYAYNGVTWGCRNHPHPAGVVKALQWSCNTYFFQAFRWIVDKVDFYRPHVGLDIFVNHLYKFGLGDTLGIDIPGEEKGSVPTSRFYDQMYPKNEGGWYSPTIISMGIGQGELLMTTVQMANVAAIIANKGTYYTPHLAKAFPNKNLTIDPKFRTPRRVDIDSSYFLPVIVGMESVVAEGTGRAAFVDGLRIAGKTGTVQNPHGLDHSTFIAFAPADNPKIAIAVYVENAGGGGRYAAPIAGLLIEQYLNRTINANRKWLETNIQTANLIDRP